MTYTLIPGQKHKATEEETMSVIRSVLDEDANPKPVEPAAPVETEVEEAIAFSPRTMDPATRRRADDLPPLSRPAVQEEPNRRARKAPKALTALRHRMGHPRIKKRYIAIAGVALLVLFRPHWVLLGTVLTVMVALGLFLVVGPDRIWGMVLRRLQRLDVTDPARAAVARKRLDRFALRWDGVLDMFPDGTVDALYLPDFMSSADRDAQHTNAVAERLDRMMQQREA